MLICLEEKTGNNPRRVDADGFLQWAGEDLKQQSMRGVANALGNIKRAVHARLDRFIGNSHIPDSKAWNPRFGLDSKLKALTALGIDCRDDVEWLQKVRNSFEHGYIVPDAREVRSQARHAGYWLAEMDRLWRPKISIVGIPFKEYAYSVSNRGSRVSFNFKGRNAVRFFDNSKRALLTIAPISKGYTEESIPYASLDWTEMAKLEGSLWTQHEGGKGAIFPQPLKQRTLTNIFYRYLRYLDSGNSESESIEYKDN